MTSLFISYRRGDSGETVARLYEHLTARLKRWQIFYDHKHLQPGDDFPDELRRAVATAKVVLVVIGPDWLRTLQERQAQPGTDHVFEEVRLALQTGNTVLPILIRNATMPNEQDLAAFPELFSLQRKNALPLRPDPNFETDLEKLASFIDETILGVGPGMLLGGKYKLTRQIGEGGMGIVFEANDVSVKTSNVRVAIKMILEGMNTKEVLARFDGEKEALARMKHDHIAKVLDSGATPQGRPYFVMEFVAGEPITTYCDRKRLTTQERLRLFQKVCSAVQHAHTKGIVHRDIKPNNVLVEEIDGQPVPKVIDFGLAKALSGKLTEKTLYTSYTRAVGTLLYMSPEQAAGRAQDIDTRTDVYSLGVLLYELLAGEPPFTDAELERIGDDAVRQAIIKHDPPKPSTKLSSSHARPSISANRQLDPTKLAKLLKNELEWIPLKAMEKEPNQRYETPNQFSEDIDAYLNHERTIAGKPTLRQTLCKFVLRNRTAVASASAAMFSIIAAVGFYIYSIKEEQQKTTNALQQVVTEQKQKEQALRTAQLQTELASKRFDEKRNALDQMLTTFSDDKLRGQPGSQPIRKLFLERGLEQYQKMLADRADDPSVSLRTGEALRDLGIVEKELGQTAESLACLLQAVDVCRRAVSAHPDNPNLMATLGDALFEYAQALFEQKRLNEAKPFASESVEIFRSLSEKMPQVNDYRAKLGRGLVRRASLNSADSSTNTDLSQGLALLRTVVDAEPTNPDYLIFLARAISNNANNQFGFKTEALKSYQEAVQLSNRALEINPALPLANDLRAIFVRNISTTLRVSNKATEALTYLDELLPSIRQHVAENSAVIDGPVFLSEILNERAIVLQFLNRPDDAIKTFQEIVQMNDALTLRDPKNDKYPLKSIEATSTIAKIYRSQKRESDAIQLLERFCSNSHEIMSLRPASDALLGELINLHVQYGNILKDNERYEQESNIYQQALNLYDKYNNTIEAHSEFTVSMYLRCCEGLISIAKKQKNNTLAIEILENKVRPIKPDRLKIADYQQQLLTTLVGLSELYAETDRNQQALGLRLELVKNATTLLKGNISSNFYLYQIVFDSHEHIAELNRRLGNDRGSFESLRKYFAETESYVWERNHTLLLAETEDFNQKNLKRLWDAFDNISKQRPLRRFTIPVAFNGVSEPMYVYVCNSWQYLWDQITWIGTVRGGVFPQDRLEDFYRLNKLAKEHEVLFCDLCVYALGRDDNRDPKAGAIFSEYVNTKARYSKMPDDFAFQVEYLNSAIKYAISLSVSENPDRALFIVEDIEPILQTCRKSAQADNEIIARISTAIWLVRGRANLSRGNSEIAHDNLLKALQERSDFSLINDDIKGEIMFELAVVSRRLKRYSESINWYVKAAEIGHTEALDGLIYCLKDSNMHLIAILPRELITQLNATNQTQEPELSEKDFRKAWHYYSPTIQTEEVKRQAELARQNQDRKQPDTTATPIERKLKDAITRTIVLIYGKLEDGGPCWIYAAVKPSKYPKFLLDQKEGKLNLYDFKEYGEIIVSGKGQDPPEAVVLKVAEMYRTDPKLLFQPRDTGNPPDSKPILGTVKETSEELLATGSWEKLMETPTKELPRLLFIRATEFAKKGQVEEVAHCATKLREIGVGKKDALYNAACAYSLCSRLLEKGKTNSTAEELSVKQRYVDLTITCLKEAIAAGFSNFEQMASDEDLAPLRELPEFKALLPK